MKKRGLFFSIDALIALSIIIIVMLVSYPLIFETKQKTEVHYDLIETLSSLKIGELNNSYAKTLISQGFISDMNKSVLEQIGEFYVTDVSKARLLAESVFSEIDIKNDIGLWFGNTLIASKNSTAYENAADVEVARQIISGLKEGESITGYSARAYLSSSLQSDYFYFGGYVGDGNLSMLVHYNGTLSNAEAEFAINENFSLYVNGNYSGDYLKPSTELTPKRYSIPVQNFHLGDNYVELRAKNNLHITGGFIKIDYDKVVEYDKPETRYLPGIDGVINIYSGFYVPTVLNSMEIKLHFKSPYRMFMIMGNKTVFQNSSANESTIFLSNSQLSSILDYNWLSSRNIPVRLGLYAASKRGNADVVVITDLSDSMNSRFNSESDGVTRNCSDSALYSPDTKKISVAKCLDKEVVDAILEVPGNRVALSAFYGDVTPPNKGRVYQEILSSNGTYLKAKIDIYNPQGGTCICCAINDAYKILSEQSDSSRKKYVIVMSDGIPTHTCQAASGCTGTRTGLPSDEGLWLGSSSGCYGGADDCNVADCNCAVQNANWSSCRLHNNLNSTVYSIGFGNVSSCSLANSTLNNIANCGGGKYYTSDNSTILKEFYSNISQEILDLSYIEQIANVTGNFSGTRIYADSYIKLNYSRELSPFGLVATTERLFDTVDYGSFSVPANSSILKATAISYSGPKWTATASINNNTFYNLSEYGNDFTFLGDPYALRIPDNLISQDNIVAISRGISPENLTSGSTYNKIIYTILKNATSYSKISSFANGCSWNIEFDDGTNTSINVPSSYSGANTCSYSETSQQYDDNDAFQIAVYNLLRKLDLDLDSKVDIKFTEQSLSISSSPIKGIPYSWSTEAEVRAWSK